MGKARQQKGKRYKVYVLVIHSVQTIATAGYHAIG